jgi:tetratricopeptide (TPR) repeat protein
VALSSLARVGKAPVEEAIACFKKAIELDPKDAKSYTGLGTVLRDVKRDDDAAIACFKKAIELDANYAEPHCCLGHVFRNQGRFAESLAVFKRGHELGTKQPGWPHPSAEWVRQTERMAALEGQLPAFLKGEFQPRDTAERLGLIGVCHAKKLHHAATGLFAAAFAADPKLADDLKSAHRYNAACSAALAAAGQGEDAAKLEQQKTRLRKQALDWLRADLALRTKQLGSGQPADRAAVQQKLRHWQQDTDLAGIRDTAMLAKLPAEERAACKKLWADVAALLKKAAEKTK